MSEIKHFDESNFESLTSQGVALVDFWAPWCGPCRSLGPIIEDVSNEIGDKAVIGKVNCDESPNLSAKFMVKSIPAIYIIKDGNIVNQFVGVQSKETLVKAIQEHL